MQAVDTTIALMKRPRAACASRRPGSAQPDKFPDTEEMCMALRRNCGSSHGGARRCRRAIFVLQDSRQKFRILIPVRFRPPKHHSIYLRAVPALRPRRAAVPYYIAATEKMRRSLYPRESARPLFCGTAPAEKLSPITRSVTRRPWGFTMKSLLRICAGSASSDAFSAPRHVLRVRNSSSAP